MLIKKKKRKEDEMDSIMEVINSKKSRRTSCEKTIGELNETKLEKEIELKKLERTFVETLVEQQKHMLTLLKKKQA